MVNYMQDLYNTQHDIHEKHELFNGELYAENFHKKYNNGENTDKHQTTELETELENFVF